MRQAPLIAGGQAPDHTKCITISTNASLKKMIMPGVIVIVSPLLIGFLFGYTCLAGLLSGIIVSGIQIAFSASNTGGAWDNCKKHIEAGNLTLEKDGKDVVIKKKEKVWLLTDGKEDGEKYEKE